MPGTTVKHALLGIVGASLPSLISSLASGADPATPTPATGLDAGSTTIGGIVGGAFGGGFAAWVTWFLLTRYIPKREEAFEARQVAMEKRHSDHDEARVKTFREDNQSAWKTVKDNNERVLAIIESQGQKQIAVLEKLADKIGNSCKFTHHGPGS